MAQAPVAVGSGPAPSPDSPKNASPDRYLPRLPLTDGLTNLSVYRRGHTVAWKWRCEYCGKLSLLGSRVVAEDKTRVWHHPPRKNPYACCENCRRRARWNHITSEIQVNRALRSPHEFLYSDIAHHFSNLRISDRGDNLRVSGPADVGSLQTAAREWMQFPYSLTHRGSPGAYGRSPQRHQKYFLGQIRAISMSGIGSLRFWRNVRMMG